MANPLTPQQMIDALRKWSVRYELYPSWKTRESGGGSTPIGFMIHHTGGAFTESDNYLDFLFNRGRPGIPGPLCNFSIGPSGTVYVGSLENANHAGMGDWTTRQLVGGESYDGYSSEINPGADDYGTGNELFWGVEINYPGTVKMKAAQYESAVRLAACLMDAWGWQALSTIGHREHSSRKWDPGQAPMDKFRRDVRDLLAAGPGGDVAGGDAVSWGEDLSPGTPGDDITSMARSIIPEGWGMSAADLLGYAAASLAWMRNGDAMVRKIYRTDHVVRAPSRYHAKGTNPHFQPERFLRDTWDMLDMLMSVPDRLDAIEAAIHGTNATEIKTFIESKHEEAAAHRDAIAAETAVKIDGAMQLLQEHAEGNLDADQVVEGIRGLLHEATAPAEANGNQ